MQLLRITRDNQGPNSPWPWAIGTGANEHNTKTNFLATQSTRSVLDQRSSPWALAGRMVQRFITGTSLGKPTKEVCPPLLDTQ